MIREKVKCEICGKMLANCGIKNHLQFHENEKKRQAEREIRKLEKADREDLFCQYCKRKFKTTNALTQHEIRCKENPDKIDSSSCVEAMLEVHRKDPTKRGRPNPNAEKWKANGTLNCKYCSRDCNQNLQKFSNLYELIHHESRCRYNPIKCSEDISPLEIELDDDGKLFPKFSRKRSNAKSIKIEFELTFHEFCVLLKEAGIKSSQLDRTGQSYELARHNDTGSYKVGNCRFIPQIQNLKERKTSDAMRAALSRGASASAKARKQNPERYRKSHRRSVLNTSSKLNEQDIESVYIKKLIHLIKHYYRKKREAERISNLDPRYTCEHNSQTGTHWITNGIENRKWHPDKEQIPDGFRLGRVNGNKPQS